MPKVMLSPKAMKLVAPSALTVPSESPGVGCSALRDRAARQDGAGGAG